MIAGWLAAKWSAWETRGSESWVVEVLRYGYVVPFYSFFKLPFLGLPSSFPLILKGRALGRRI